MTSTRDFVSLTHTIHLSSSPFNHNRFAICRSVTTRKSERNEKWWIHCCGISCSHSSSVPLFPFHSFMSVIHATREPTARGHHKNPQCAFMLFSLGTTKSTTHTIHDTKKLALVCLLINFVEYGFCLINRSTTSASNWMELRTTCWYIVGIKIRRRDIDAMCNLCVFEMTESIVNETKRILIEINNPFESLASVNWRALTHIHRHTSYRLTNARRYVYHNQHRDRLRS